MLSIFFVKNVADEQIQLKIRHNQSSDEQWSYKQCNQFFKLILKELDGLTDYEIKAMGFGC